MSTIIYNHYYKELDCDVAHVDERGIVYSDPIREAGYSCGHLGDGGRVYSHPVAKSGYCLGHVDESGKIYDHPTSKAGHCVGHIDSNGVVYSHSNNELGYEVGHVKGPHYKQAGAYYLLAMYKANGNAAEAPVTSNVSSDSSSNSVSSSYEAKDSYSSSRSKNISIPSSDVGGGGNLSGIILVIGVAIVLGLIKTVVNLVINYPILILFYIYMAKGLLSPSSKRKVNDFKVTEDERQRCKEEAKSNLPKHIILPVILTVYSLIKNQPFDSGKLIPLLAPAVLIIFYGYFQNYMNNLYNAEKASKSKGSQTVKKTVASEKKAVERKPEVKKEASNEKKPQVKKEAEVQTPEKVIVECTNPDCKAKIRVPAGKGKVKLKCPKCNNEIITNT